MNDPSLQGVFSALRYLLVTIGTALAAHGYGGSHLYQIVEFSGGAVMIVGPAVWGVYTAVQNFRVTHHLATIVQPGFPKQAIADAKAAVKI